MICMEGRFDRIEAMFSREGMERLSRTKVAVFGVGGVGSWCAEALVRSGIGEMMIVDPDAIAPSNLNRQLMALDGNVGEIKVEAMAARLKAINPDIVLDVRSCAYTPQNAGEFDLGSCDFVVDAIDSLVNKAALVRHALSFGNVRLFSSMGAAMKKDPTQVRTSVFRKIEGDPLARALRGIFRKSGGIPERDFVCVWSPEKRIEPAIPGIKGSFVCATAAFGLALAALVVDSAISR